MTDDGYPFAAPRYGDLVGCPYCELGRDCDHCDGEGILFASEVFTRCESLQAPLTAGDGGKTR
jgi:hypothetical protein